MDRLRLLISHIGNQLNVLTVSQRVAIGLCAALIAGSIFWLLQWSTTPEMVPLVNHEFSFAELRSAEAALQQGGIDFDVLRDSQIFVRPADRLNAKRLVFDAGAMPGGSLFDMEAAVMDQNPFLSPEQRSFGYNVAKGNELAKIIATTPFVQKASVIINPRSKRRLGMANDVPTAAVDVTLSANREMTSDMVEGIAKLVSRAVSGLKPHDVSVRDSRTGRSHGIPHPDDALSFDILGQIKKHEAHMQNKIEKQLAYIPGVHVSVSVDLDMSKRTTQTYDYDQPEVKTEKTNSTETNSSSQPSETGVQANVGTAVTGGAGGQASSTDDSTTENFEPKLLETELVEQIPLSRKRITATVGIPRSFIVGLVSAKNPEKSEPKDSDPDFVSARDAQIERVKASVVRIVQAEASEDVQVDIYPDMTWSAENSEWLLVSGNEVAAQQVDDSLDAVGLLRNYGPPAGLGTLALMSLLMMSRIVRRSADLVNASVSGQSQEEAGHGSDDEPMLAVGPMTVGQAQASDSLLTGREVDESTLRHQELGVEVSKMVEEDPQGAAELVQRWIDEDHQ